MSDYDDEFTELYNATAEAIRLIDERKMYRDALQEILDFEPEYPHIRTPYEQIAAFAKNTARLVLAPKKEA